MEKAQKKYESKKSGAQRHTGKFECQNKYYITTENYVTENGKDFDKGVGDLE